MSLIDRVRQGTGLSEKDLQDRPRLEKTVQYLETKNIEGLFQELLAEVLEELPADPRAFLVAKLQARKGNSRCFCSVCTIFVYNSGAFLQYGVMF
jgi:hypothetical protein